MIEQILLMTCPAMIGAFAFVWFTHARPQPMDGLPEKNARELKWLKRELQKKKVLDLGTPSEVEEGE